MTRRVGAARDGTGRGVCGCGAERTFTTALPDKPPPMRDRLTIAPTTSRRAS